MGLPKLDRLLRYGLGGYDKETDLGRLMARLETIDHDQIFKELISTFFMEFLELFLPEIAATIDPGSIRFLQQEYFLDLVEG
jgi:hypothetical protein